MSEKLFKGYKIRLNPTIDQQKLLFNFSSAARIMYNLALNFNQEFYEAEDNSPQLSDYNNFIQKVKQDPKYQWLDTVPYCVLQGACNDLMVAFTRYFDEVSRKPRFKPVYAEKSFYQRKDRFKVDHIACWLTDIGKVDFADYFVEANYGKEYSNPRVIYNGKHWYITFAEEVKVTPTPRSLDGVGVAIGSTIDTSTAEVEITELAVVSNGDSYKSVKKCCHEILRLEEKISQLDSEIARLKKINKKLAFLKFLKKYYGFLSQKLFNYYGLPSFRFSKVKAKKVTLKVSRNKKSVVKVDKKIIRYLKCNSTSIKIRTYEERRRQYFRKIQCCRENYLHQVSNSIVKPEYVISEEEKIFRNLTNKAKRLVRSIADQKSRIDKLLHSKNPPNFKVKKKNGKKSNTVTTKIKKSKKYIEKLEAKLEECATELSKFDYRTKSKNFFKIPQVVKPSPNYVCVETLGVKELCKQCKEVAKAVMREAFYKLETLVKYKCRRLGISFIEVPKRISSEITCNNCGTEVWSLKDPHTFVCSHCELSFDKDLNVALNLKKEGLRILQRSEEYSVTPLDLSNLPFSCTLDESIYCSICTVKEKCGNAWSKKVPFYCSNYNSCDFSNCNCYIGDKDYSSVCKKEFEKQVANLPFSCGNFSSCDLNSCCVGGRDYSSVCRKKFEEWVTNLPFSCSNFSSSDFFTKCAISCSYFSYCNRNLILFGELPFIYNNR